jgi:hypothetical protein
MTDDNPQLQNTVLVVGCSDSPVTSVVSTVLSSWKLQCARDNDEALALVEKAAFDLVIADQARKILNCFARYGWSGHILV